MVHYHMTSQSLSANHFAISLSQSLCNLSQPITLQSLSANQDLSPMLQIPGKFDICCSADTKRLAQENSFRFRASLNAKASVTNDSDNLADPYPPSI